jgi:hypothetical protein
MKRTLYISALTLCCVVLLSYSLAIQHRSTPAPDPGSAISAPSSLADGGTPPPPWPPKPTTRFADGGTPPAPWPAPSKAVVADGGTPPPPWPPKPPSKFADGGTPPPPWPWGLMEPVNS